VIHVEIYIARQPIFNRNQRVVAYELLYRSGVSNRYNGEDPDKATLQVIQNLFLHLGSQQLTHGAKAFINFTRNLLLNETALHLPPKMVVVEILEDVDVDQQLHEACLLLRQKGYLIALDDYVFEEEDREILLDVADIVKVDFVHTTQSQRTEIVERLLERRVRPLAEKVETQEEFCWALKHGYTFFQGHFFCKPVLISSREIPGHKLNYLRVIQAANQRELDLASLEEIIRGDLSLCYKLLQYINSAFFGVRHPIRSVRHALLLLGEVNLRKWVSLVAMAELGRDKPPELLRTSLLRARFSELLAQKIGLGKEGSEGFLLGMFSTLDAFLGRPLGEMLEGIPIGKEIKGALLGEDTPFRDLYELILCYEKGNWIGFEEYAGRLRISAQEVTDIYLESLGWVEEITRLDEAESASSHREGPGFAS